MERGNTVIVQDPPIARMLFSDVRFAWVWLIVRLWLGYEWVEAGLHKVTDPAWMQTGEGLKGFLTRAVAIPATGRPPISYDWYRDFLNGILGSGAYTWMAPVVAVGEVLVGIGLILGAFVGLAAFFGSFMNMNFMLAGTASTNPVLFGVAVLLILAWKTAGYWGLDRFLLPVLGTPWYRGALLRRSEQPNLGRPIGQAANTSNDA